MINFELSKNIIERVKEILKNAEKYIHIAVFQLHREDIFRILLDRLKTNIEIEIFTLPFDSIHKNQEDIINNFKKLQKNGAKIYHCHWNVGDPGRTTTAVGQWYSFHGKFIVTDKNAVGMTTNLTQNTELDAILIYENDNNKLLEFEAKFNNLKELFVQENLGYNGIIRQKIIDTGLDNIQQVFNLPKSIKTTIYKNHWIQHYPSIICPETVPIENKLYITPFDCRGVNFLKDIISQANKFIYISTESFTDPNFPNFLKKKSLKNLEIKILSGVKSMDFTDRVQNMFRELLAHDIKIRTRNDNLHAKLIITENHLVLSSINLNRISLGFKPKKNYWRENTETINICTAPSIIRIASKQFNSIFNNSIEIEKKLEERMGENIGKSIRYIFDINSISSDVKSIIGHLIVSKEIQTKKFLLELGKCISEIIKKFYKSRVNVEIFQLALVFYFITERKMTYDELEEKVKSLNIKLNLNNLLNILIKKGLILKVSDYYSKLEFEKIL